MYYPSFASSSDLSNPPLYLEKAPADHLLRPTAVRIIQLDEIPAPPPQPRRLPPSSASASSSSASSSMDEDEEEGSEYCSSVDDGEEDEELALARAVEANKMTRILAWRAQFTPLPASPTTAHPARMNFLSRKRSVSSCSSNSTPHSKRSRTSASPAPSLHRTPRQTKKAAGNNTFLAPPSPTALARRHTSPRHQPSASLHIPAPLKIQQQLHHRALSFSAHADTLCPACDRRFSSKRAFRVHASLGGDGDAEGAAACTAAVAYSMEECGRSM